MDDTKNSKTLLAYEEHADKYVAGTRQVVDGTVKEWLDMTIAGVKKDATIFELGSGFGRDAKYLEGLGYTVQCSDAPDSFVELLRKNGLRATKFNALADDFPDTFDIILANAVLLHFTRDETKKVLQKVYGALGHGGVFAFTVKEGEGEEWSDAKLGALRYFCYWNDGEITELLKTTGFHIEKIWTGRETRHATWLQIIVRKP